MLEILNPELGAQVQETGLAFEGLTDEQNGAEHLKVVLRTWTDSVP
jgi:hypothetical protein